MLNQRSGLSPRTRLLAALSVLLLVVSGVAARSVIADEVPDHGDHDPYAGCDEDHPVTVDIRSRVTFALENIYTDVAALTALGYHPYFDGAVPGGYPPGGEGVAHWIGPHYIDDGVVLDPLRPEAILLDDWNRPIGMMFIEESSEPGPPVYVNEDGTPCYPWHPHTDAPARFGWMWYRAIYDESYKDGSMEYPDQTPAMMHVWVNNPNGTYNGHDYPPTEYREGPPGPLPSYLRGGTVEETADQALGG
jgi:hypothetical protein